MSLGTPENSAIQKLFFIIIQESDTFCGSRRYQEEGGELDYHEKVRLSFAGPGEIKRREVVLDPELREPRRDQEQGGGAGLRKLDFFCFDCYSTAVLRTLSL